MKLIITNIASKWFQDNYDLKPGDWVRIYGKTIQPRDVHHGPRQGFAPERDLSNATVIEKKDGINYHINFNDSWFFSGLVTLINSQNNDQYPAFFFQREENGQVVTADNFIGENVDATTGASSKFEDYWE